MKTLLTLLLTVGIAATACAQSLVNVDKNGLGLKGYDPVAFFTDQKPVPGKPEFQARYEGVTYQFATAAHQADFQANPQKYAPQFGGFCAWAVSQGYTAPIDPKAFQIVDGRLILQYSVGIRDKFNKDTQGNLKKAEANWPGLVAKKGK